MASSFLSPTVTSVNGLPSTGCAVPKYGVCFCLCSCLTSRSQQFFQSCWDGATTSWVLPVLYAQDRYGVHLNSVLVQVPFMQVHILYIKCKHPTQKIARLPTPVCRQRPQGFLPKIFGRPRSIPNTRIFLFPMLTTKHFFSIPDLHVTILTSNLCMDVALGLVV